MVGARDRKRLCEEMAAAYAERQARLRQLRLEFIRWKREKRAREGGSQGSLGSTLTAPSIEGCGEAAMTETQKKALDLVSSFFDQEEIAGEE